MVQINTFESKCNMPHVHIYNKIPPNKQYFVLTLSMDLMCHDCCFAQGVKLIGLNVSQVKFEIDQKIKL